VWLYIGDSSQMAVVELVEEIDHVLDELLALRRITHDRRRVLERIADVAVPVATGADEHVDRILLIAAMPGCVSSPHLVKRPSITNAALVVLLGVGSATRFAGGCPGRVPDCSQN